MSSAKETRHLQFWTSGSAYGHWIVTGEHQRGGWKMMGRIRAKMGLLQPVVGGWTVTATVFLFLSSWDLQGDR